jgi:hypothetical protein
VAQAVKPGAAGTGPGSTVARFSSPFWNPEAEEVERKEAYFRSIFF